MWDKEDCSRKGSLVLGTGTSINSQQTGGEKTKLGKIWDIKVDKKPRHLQDRLEAQQLIEECERIDYQAMFNKGKALDPREQEAKILEAVVNQEQASKELDERLAEEAKQE